MTISPVSSGARNWPRWARPCSARWASTRISTACRSVRSPRRTCTARAGSASGCRGPHPAPMRRPHASSRNHRSSSCSPPWRPTASLDSRLHRGVTVHESLLDHAGRVVGVRAEQDGEVIEFRHDLVVACDGRGSVLRRKSGLGGSDEEDQESFDVVWVRTPPLDDGTGPGLSRPLSRLGPHPRRAPHPQRPKLNWATSSRRGRSVRSVDSARRPGCATWTSSSPLTSWTRCVRGPTS